VFTIHNAEFQGKFTYQTLTDVFGLSGALFAEGTVELDGGVNLMKGAAETADCLTTVSPGYAQELTEEAHSLGPILASHKIRGIRNGIPKDANPWDCRLVHRPYNRDSVEEKLFNKLWMQEQHGLTVAEQPPVFGCVSRLLPRKGFSLLAQVLPKYLAQGAQLVVTGQGDEQVAADILQLKEKFPNQVDLRPYSEENAVEIYSSADMLLMPSQEEPCGTAQMQAMAYGTIPVVHWTGGLRDTVTHYDRDHPAGWGFVFTDYTPAGLETALDQALAAYGDIDLWETLEKRCMALDFSWDAPVQEYRKCYESIL
jgi:starch synthase